MGIWIMLALLSLARLSAATDWYIENAGSDANACTSAAKCQTFHRLIERTLTPGDTLSLKCGETYREEQSTITPLTSGTQAAPITLGAYGTCFRYEGLHEGGAGATLVDVGRDFSAGGVSAAEMSRGITLFNLTDGSTCNVTSVTTTTTTNDSLVCERGLSGGKNNAWAAGDRYRIDNAPTVTHASLFASGWTNEGSNVWSHAFTQHPGRMLWINGWSPHNALHTGTCSASGMASATDRQWCAVCNSGSSRGCGPGKVYIKSTSDPATRWTNPGVEVVHLFDNQTGLFSGSTRPWWIVRNLAFERVYGQILSWEASNITLDGLRLGWAQRHNCRVKQASEPNWSAACTLWQGNTYLWLQGQDARGGANLRLSSSTAITGLTVRGLLLYECDNDCVSLIGGGSITGTFTDLELFNAQHVAANLGSTGGGTGSRNLILTRWHVHGVTVGLHTGGTNVTHSTLVQHSLFRDLVPTGSVRLFSNEGRTDPFNVFVEDPGTFTFTQNISTGGGHGFRIKGGNVTFNNNIVQGNSNTGINAASAASIRLNNNIIADNGTGTVSTSRFQVGCQFSPCSHNIFKNSASNTNKFRQPSGSNFAAFSGTGLDASVSLAEWQAITGGDSASVTTDDCFVNAAGLDYNLATGCDDIAALRGPFRDITPTSSESTGAILTTIWAAGSGLPVSACDVADATVTYNAAGQTEQTCVAGSPSSNATTMTMAAAPGVGATVLMSGAYGLVEDSTRVGGILNARSRAFTNHAVTNTGSAPITTGCVVGPTREIPAGSNRLLVLNACWERQAPLSPPLSLTSCTYGGQALTKVAETLIGSPDPPVLASQWILNESGLAAATTPTLACTPSLTPENDRPVFFASCVYSDVNQGTPLLGSTRTATSLSGTSLSTTALSTTANPGVALTMACAGNNGAWTPGSGWTKHVDTAEDSNPGARLFVADHATAGQTTLTGAATFSSAQTPSNRLSMITSALNGGVGQPVSATPTFSQTHVTGYRARYPEGAERFCPLDGQCELAPGSQFTVRAQVEVEGAAAPAAVYEWWCSDNGAPFYKVSNASTGWISFAPSFRLNEPLINLLPLDGDAFVACGIHYNILTTDPGSCSTTLPGQRFEYEFSGVLSSAAVIGQQVVCRLRQAGGVELGTYSEDVEIPVISPQAIGH